MYQSASKAYSVQRACKEDDTGFDSEDRHMSELMTYVRARRRSVGGAPKKVAKSLNNIAINNSQTTKLTK